MLDTTTAPMAVRFIKASGVTLTPEVPFEPPSMNTAWSSIAADMAQAWCQVLAVKPVVVYTSMAAEPFTC